jgi:hypothetical protein
MTFNRDSERIPRPGVRERAGDIRPNGKPSPSLPQWVLNTIDPVERLTVESVKAISYDLLNPVRSRKEGDRIMLWA